MKKLHLNSVFRRLRPLGAVIGSILIVAGLIAGCKPKSAATAANAGAYFQTPFQTECEFIVYTIITDLAEQMYYAANHRLPDKESFAVTILERPTSTVARPVYGLQIRLDPKLPKLDCEVAINGPIWSAQDYEKVAVQIAEAVALKPATSRHDSDTMLLAKLSDAKPETIERENQRLSSALEDDFSDPELHEQAAVLLGAFLLREHSGLFFEIRSPLSRLTSHLTMAHFLRGAQPAGVNGQMAEAIMLTLTGNQTQALEGLKGIGTNNIAVMPMLRALQVRNTGDFRLLDKMDGLSRMETAAWFSAWADYVSTTVAWPKLSDGQKQTIDFLRAAGEMNYSVEIGHHLLELSVPLEIEEAQNVYELSQQKKLSEKKVVQVLNELPDGCFTRTESKPALHVIGWGQWAGFLQRHLCHAIQQNFYFMNTKWGVPDEAKEFAARCAQSFNGLRLYPFVRRFNCTDEKGYQQSVDDGFKVTVATPQLVSAECWNYLCYKVGFAPAYSPVPNPHINEWHNHNPLPGTVYDLNPRLNHPSLVAQPDTITRFEQLHEIAPYDCRIIQFLLNRKYNGKATYEQTTSLFNAVLSYSVLAMRSVAYTIYQKPEQYRNLMLQVAALNPAGYYDLGDYEIDRDNLDEGAKLIDKACAVDADSVRVASRAPWRVRYYLKKGEVKKARAIADEGGEVYSFRGLEAKAIFLEGTTNYDGAFEWYARIEERYNDSKPMVEFCGRYKPLTGDAKFEPELKKRQQKVFPDGMKKVSLTDFKNAPTDGVLIEKGSKLIADAGLRVDDVIVALNGTRVHSSMQYTYVRSLLSEPEMSLVVWQGGSYREIKASPPNQLFNTTFGDYKPK